MDISVVIVNFNVKHFLEQCLHSVEKSIDGLKAEIFVVDNNSVDGSCQMVREKFPCVRLIENKKNVGFAKANNQAIKECRGRYVLILNPDTFLQEDTLVKCVKFGDNNPKAGAIGVKMIDGKGKFLPESKRALPTPEIAFYKTFGLSALFPKSRRFGKYHLGHLDKNKTHKVEILAGAFMLLRKQVLDEIGYLDETFFMYGEDIDLSYRIIKAGYENYYYPDTTIIHYKGESTKKGSINYVMVFYKAMIIFANKHFSAKRAWLYRLLINIAIYFRASIGVLRRVMLQWFRPVADFVVSYAGMYLLTSYWEKYRFNSDNYYPEEYFKYLIPIMITTWLFFLYLFGAYERKVKPAGVLKGVISGLLFILLVYALLPESYRFSRALLFIGAGWALIAAFIVRLLSGMLFKAQTTFELGNKEKRIAIVGSEKEASRVIEILLSAGLNYKYVGRVIAEEQKEENILGTISQINEIIRINKIDELVFCSSDLSASEIIKTMLIPEGLTTTFKIAPPESVSVIGSNSINTAGDLYVVDINSLAKGMNKRKKRMFDILSGILLLLFYPVLVFLVPNIMRFLKNIIFVLGSKYTWVGVPLDRQQDNHQTQIKKGILEPSDNLKVKNADSTLKQRMNIMYAKNYRIYNDIVIMFRNYRLLGRKV